MLSASKRREQIIAMRTKKQQEGYETLVYDSKYFSDEYKDEYIEWVTKPHNEHRSKLLVANTGCVDKDTEYFNGTEWVAIGDYKEGDKVLQYNVEGTAELVKPMQYHKYKCEELNHIKTKYGIDQVLSDEHNVVTFRPNGTLVKQNMVEWLEQHKKSEKGHTGRFATTFIAKEGTGIKLSDEELRVQIMVMADGYFPKYTDKTKRCVVRVKKKRKQERLEKLLKEAKIKFHQTKSSVEGFNVYVFKAPIKIKNYPKEWYNFSKKQAKIIFEESILWDGYKNGKVVLTSTSKSDADFMQMITIANGYRSSISVDSSKRKKDMNRKRSVCYSVHYTTRVMTSVLRSNGKTEITKYKTLDGFKYCFSVPSGLLVLRRNNKIFVTGNSGKTFTTVTELSKLGEKVIFLTPNIAVSIELSQSKDYEGVACWGGYNIFESAKNDDLGKGKVIFMTYAQLDNLVKVKDIYHDYYLVVDEAHVLVNENEINVKAISALTKMKAEGGYFKNLLYITATPKPLIYALGRENVQVMDFRKKNNDLRYHINNIIVPKDGSLIGVTSWLLNNIKGKVLVLSPTDKVLNKVLGDSHDATVINADNKMKCKVFDSIVNEKLVPKDAPKVTIMTNLLSAGLNLMNEDIEDIVIVGSTDQTLIRQFSARLRKAKKVNVFVVSTFSFNGGENYTRDELMVEANATAQRLNGLTDDNDVFNKRLEGEEHIISYTDRTLNEDFTIFEINEFSIGASLYRKFSNENMLNTALFYPEGESVTKNYMVKIDPETEALKDEMKTVKESKKLKSEIECEEVLELVENCASWLYERNALDEVKALNKHLTDPQIKLIERIVKRLKKHPELDANVVAKMLVDEEYENQIRFAVYRFKLDKADTKVNKTLQRVLKLKIGEEVNLDHEALMGLKNNKEKKRFINAIWNTAQLSERPWNVQLLGKKPKLEELNFRKSEVDKLVELYIKKPIIKTVKKGEEWII